MRPDAIVPRPLDRILDRRRAPQIDGFADDGVFRNARCVGFEDELANVGFVAEAGRDAVFVADYLFLEEACISPYLYADPVSSRLVLESLS